MGFFSNLFGGSRRSSSSQKTVTTTTMPTATATEGSQSIAAGGGVTINELDDQAIEKSFDFARKIYEGQRASFNDIVNKTFDYAKYGIDTVKKQSDMVALAYQTAEGVGQPLNYQQVAMAGAGLLAFALYMKRRRA